MTSNVVKLPIDATPDDSVPSRTAKVMDAAFRQKLRQSNGVVRRLRDWGICVKDVRIPPADDVRPTITIDVDPSRSIKPLLDATPTTHKWVQDANGKTASHLTAVLDECLVVLALGEARRATA
jgi:hypothetical protein